VKKGCVGWVLSGVGGFRSCLQSGASFCFEQRRRCGSAWAEWGQRAGRRCGATGMSWVTMRDTREKAFSIQVPQGWKTYGGLFRFSTIDARMIVDMTSPDGLTNLRVGDSTVPPYRVPGPFLPPRPGVAAYAAGNVFATKYGQARFAPMCQGLQLTKSEALAPKYHPRVAG